MRRVEAFRIYKSRYASSALTGEGAKKHGGRWNHEGVAVLYCSSSLALAQLETLVHLEGALPPGESNFLLNPAHPDFRKITIGTSSPVEWDSRLLKRLRID